MRKVCVNRFHNPCWGMFIHSPSPGHGNSRGRLIQGWNNLLSTSPLLRRAWSWPLTTRGGLHVDMAGPKVAKEMVRKGCMYSKRLVEEGARESDRRARAVATTRGLSSFRRLKHCLKPLTVSALSYGKITLWACRYGKPGLCINKSQQASLQERLSSYNSEHRICFTEQIYNIQQASVPIYWYGNFVTTRTYSKQPQFIYGVYNLLTFKKYCILLLLINGCTSY